MGILGTVDTRPLRRLGWTSAPSVKVSWERQGWPLRILRAFLGATFVYAGTQKLADPNFLRSGTPDFIGSQLHAFATGSPIRGLLLFLDHFPDLTGLGIALLETAVGVATLLGVAPITAAAVGFGVNLMLMLSATWHVHPYFLGSDSMYAVAWLAYGAGLVEMERRAARAAARSRGRRSARVRSSPKSFRWAGPPPSTPRAWDPRSWSDWVAIRWPRTAGCAPMPAAWWATTSNSACWPARATAPSSTPPEEPSRWPGPPPPPSPGSRWPSTPPPGRWWSRADPPRFAARRVTMTA